jgi:hypothetical protein
MLSGKIALFASKLASNRYSTFTFEKYPITDDTAYLGGISMQM